MMTPSIFRTTCVSGLCLTKMNHVDLESIHARPAPRISAKTTMRNIPATTALEKLSTTGLNMSFLQRITSCRDDSQCTQEKNTREGQLAPEWHVQRPYLQHQHLVLRSKALRDRGLTKGRGKRTIKTSMMTSEIL